MNISLTSNLEKYVNDKLKTGLYSSASEVIREGLRLLMEQDLKKQERTTLLNQEIAVGLDHIKQGKVFPGKQVFKEIRQKSGH